MHKRSIAATIALAALVPLAVGMGEAHAQAGQSQRAQATGDEGTFFIADRKIFSVAPTGYYSAEDRVLENMRRVIRVIEPEAIDETGLEGFNVGKDVQVRQVGDTWVVMFKTVEVVTVTPDDVKAHDMPARQIAQMWANNLKAGLENLETERAATLKTALSQMRVAVGGQTVATGISGSTPTMVSNRIRRAIDRDPELRNEGVFIDVQPDEVIIRGEVPSRRMERRIETIVEDEAFERSVRSDLRIEGTQGQ